MKVRNKQGFTIVELLIVIVVIGILAAISIVAYNGVQQRALNTARINELHAWERVFKAYVAANDEFPSSLTYQTPDYTSFCLGGGFPVGAGGVARCRDYEATGYYSYLESDNATLMTELSDIAQMPSSEKKPAGGTVGPYVQRDTEDRIVITAAIDGRNGYSCPSETTHGWASADRATLLCAIVVQLP